MIQGLFDETEDKSQSEKGENKAKTSAFNNNVLFEITELNTRVPEPKPTFLPDEKIINAVEPDAESTAEPAIPESVGSKMELAEEKTNEVVEQPDDEQTGEVVEENPDAEMIVESFTEVTSEEIEDKSGDEVENKAADEIAEKVENKNDDMIPGEVENDDIIADDIIDEEVENKADDVNTEEVENDDHIIDEEVENKADDVIADDVEVETGEKFDEAVERESEENFEDEDEEILSPPSGETDSEERQHIEPEAENIITDTNKDFTTSETPKTEEHEFFQAQTRPEPSEETSRKTGLALSAGIALFGSVAFMLIIGWFADLLLGTSPWGIVAGIVVGSAIGFLQFFRTTSQILKKDD